MATVSRTVDLRDLTPEELATLFAGMTSDKQAEFFAVVWDIAKAWPGAGWCQQSCDIVRLAGEYPGAREAIAALADHLKLAAA